MLVFLVLLSACNEAPVPGDKVIPVSGNVVVYAIRHMEKDLTPGVQDPELTEEGAARAQTLATFLTDVDLAAIYSTPYNRTTQTVEPTAAAQGLEIDTNFDGTTQLASHILNNHDKEIVIASGHSNTVPSLMSALGVADTPTIEESSYGEMWVVNVEDGVATAVLTPFE